MQANKELNTKECLASYLVQQVANNRLSQISGAVFVDHKIGQYQAKANTTVADFVNNMTEDQATELLKSLTDLDKGKFVTHDEVTILLEKWLALGEPDRRPSNRDLVKSDNIDMGLLHNLVSFTLVQAMRSGKL